MTTKEDMASPLPWFRDGCGIFAADKDCVAATGDDGDDMDAATQEANAILIVRAVNAHDELVRALRELLEAIETDPLDMQYGEYAAILLDARQRAHAALAKATT